MAACSTNASRRPNAQNVHYTGRVEESRGRRRLGAGRAEKAQHWGGTVIGAWAIAATMWSSITLGMSWSRIENSVRAATACRPAPTPIERNRS